MGAFVIHIDQEIRMMSTLTSAQPVARQTQGHDENDTKIEDHNLKRE